MRPIRRIQVVGLVMAAVILAVGSRPVFAQAGDQTGTEFYMAFRAAFQKAKAIEELLPFLSKMSRDQIESTPAKERPEMFKIMKSFNTYTNVKC